ncbi:hypothetical protein U1Q18_024156 [Sarracenia purpurea var. burkii]
MMRTVLNEDANAAFSAGESFPERETNSSGDRLLGGGVFEGAELFEPPDDEVVGQDAAFVLPIGAVGDQTVLVQSHHDVGALAVHLRP